METANIGEDHLYIYVMSFIYPWFSLRVLITETNRKQIKDKQKREIFTRKKSSSMC